MQIIEDSWIIVGWKPEQFKKWCSPSSIKVKGSNLEIELNAPVTVISEAYAKWFLENKIWEILNTYSGPNRVGLYEKAVRRLCKHQNIKFEGI